MMKRSAFLVNTARGNIVDESALVEALLEGTIAGAGLDVYSVEPPAADNPLLALPNVIFSPHVAARGPVAARYTRLFDNLTALAEGRSPEGVVNPEVLR
jgi:phosphoglycerate dehydrogenase-like enzyme